MNYLVMECGLAYAVVMDDRGQFFTVPNLGYQVGQTLSQVALLPPKKRRAPAFPWAMAACLCLLLGSWQVWKTPVGAVRMTINPDVELQVNRFDRVVDIKGLNQDGEALIAGYRSYGQPLTAVTDGLADRAMTLGYLKEGGDITITADSKRAEWKTTTEEVVILELEVHLGNTIAVHSDNTAPQTPPAELPQTPPETPPEAPPEAPPETPPQEAPNTPPPAPPVSPVTPPAVEPDPPSGSITMEQAKAIALADAGLTEATFTKSEADEEDGDYELEFIAGNRQYEYEIDSRTGKITDKDTERLEREDDDDRDDWDDNDDDDDWDDDDD